MKETEKIFADAYQIAHIGIFPAIPNSLAKQKMNVMNNEFWPSIQMSVLKFLKFHIHRTNRYS